MNVLVPKKGSKEQVKLEEGRLVYAMLAEQPINLAKLVVERLRAVMGRKSSPVCYGMHLMEIMERAGVDLRCVESDEIHFNSVIDHHTLLRLGYKKGHSGWGYVGKGKDQAQVPRHEAQEEREDEEEGREEEGEAEQATQESQPTHPPHTRPKTTPSHPSSHTPHLATKSDVAHLQSFLVEQLHLLQATLLSKLDSLDSRVQNLESHLIFQPPPSPHFSPIHDPTDPKGKRPVSPIPSHHTPSPSPPPEPFMQVPPSPQPSPQPTPQPSPQRSPSPPFVPYHLSHPLGSPIVTFPSSPIPIDSTASTSPSSSTSSSTDANRYALVVRAPSIPPRSPSVDSEATTSDHHSPPPPPTHPPSPPHTQPPTTTYRRRRLLPPP